MIRFVTKYNQNARNISGPTKRGQREKGKDRAIDLVSNYMMFLIISE